MAKQKERENVSYNVSQEYFVYCWETSETINQVVEKLEAYAKENKCPAMPKPIIMARAHGYRNLGINLKKMKRTFNKAVRVSNLNTLIEQIRAGEKIKVDAGEVKFTPPPESTKISEGGRSFINKIVKARAKSQRN